MRIDIQVSHDDGTVNHFSSVTEDMSQDTVGTALTRASGRLWEFYPPEVPEIPEEPV